MKSAYNFVPRCYGAYPDADLRNDDFHLHRAREGDGNYGSVAWFLP